MTQKHQEGLWAPAVSPGLLGRGNDQDITLQTAFPERAGRRLLFFPFPWGVGDMAEGPRD